MTTSLIPVAPALDEPLEILSACHGRVLAQLDTLQRLLPHLAAHGADGPARQAAAAVLRYFDSAAKHHHDDEEIDLLPALEAAVAPASAAALVAVRQRVLDEHVRLYALWAALRPQLDAVRLGLQSSLDGQSVFDMDAAYRQHIEFEESHLLPLARQLLDQQTLRDLGRAMTLRRSAPPVIQATGG